MSVICKAHVVISIVPKIFRFIVYSELADTNCEGDYVENLMLFVKTANFIIFKAPFNSNGIQNFPHTLKITRQSKGIKTSSHF